MNRSKFQQEQVELWLDNNKRGNFILSVGLGKSRIAVLASAEIIKENPNSRIVIGVPLSKLKEDTWKAEFYKWGYGEIYENNIEVHCYQSLYKWRGEKIDLLISDELDTSLTESYYNLYLNNDFKYFLGLTGTLPKDKVELAEKLAPILNRVSTKEAYQLGFINNTIDIAIYYELSKVGNIKVTYGKKHFYTSESKQYEYWDKKFNEAKEELEELGCGSLGSHAFKLMRISEDKEIKKLLSKYAIAMRKRKDILLNSITSSMIAKSVISKIKRGLFDIDNPKFLVFSESINHIESICDHVVHSKKKAKDNSDEIERFNSEEIDILGACKGLTVGINFRNLNIGLFAGYYSSERDKAQRSGRLNRLDYEDLGYNIYLVCKDTQQEQWFNKMISDQSNLIKYNFNDLN